VSVAFLTALQRNILAAVVLEFAWRR